MEGRERKGRGHRRGKERKRVGGLLLMDEDGKEKESGRGGA